MLHNTKQDWTVAKVFGEPYSYKYEGSSIWPSPYGLVNNTLYTGYEWDSKYYITEMGCWIYTGMLPKYHHTKQALSKQECNVSDLMEAVLEKLIGIERRLDNLEDSGD